MGHDLNKLRNADFSRAGRVPPGWTWTGTGAVRWARLNDASGVRISSAAGDGRACWTQKFRCRQEHHYRVEALVSCACAPASDADPGNDGTGGMVFELRALDRGGRVLSTVRTAPLRSADHLTLRCYFKTAAKTHSLEVSVGLRHAAGTADILEVRALPVLEVEYRSYPVAVPPPPFANAPPQVVRRVCVCTAQADRPLVQLLRRRLGAAAVTVCPPSRFQEADLSDRALLLPDTNPPRGCRSMAGLMRLAEQRVVIASTSLLAAVSGDRLSTRLVEQDDDPLHARVHDSNFVTQAFALRDIFPFAGRADHSARMTQRHFRGGPAFRDFCSRHNLQTMLTAMTDSDATSGQPVALLRQSKQGALVVMDAEPLEAVLSSLDEPTLAANLYFAALGLPQATLGQYSAPARTAEELNHHLCDLVDRFPELYWHGRERPPAPGEPALIGLGRDLEALGLPMPLRPVILLRSGLCAADLDGVYAVLLWLKQLVRRSPFVSPYARTLISRFRILWVPLSDHLPVWAGWRGNRSSPVEFGAEFEPGTVAAVIDVTTSTRHALRVVTPRADGFHQDLAEVLPALADRLISGRHFFPAVPRGGDPADRSRAEWRLDDLRPEVATAVAGFTDPLHRAARAAGGRLIRIEAPAALSEATASSIWRTDWLAGVLEHVVGLLLGLVVVNRDPTAVRLTWPRRLAALRAGAVLRRFDCPDEDLPVPRAGGNVVEIPPGQALVAVRG